MVVRNDSSGKPQDRSGPGARPTVIGLRGGREGSVQWAANDPRFSDP